MRLLVFSDVHADWTTGGLERGDEVGRALVQVRRYLSMNPIDVVLFLGDWCDPDSAGTHRAAAKAIEFHRSFANKSYWLTGNHDIVNDGHGSHTLMGLKEAGGHVIDEPRAVALDAETLLVGLPYTSLAWNYDPDAFIRTYQGDSITRHRRRVIVIGHMTKIEGITPGSETDEMGRGRDLEFPVAACREIFGDAVVMMNGHFHKRVTTGPVLIPGSLARLTHGEERNEPGFLVVTL